MGGLVVFLGGIDDECGLMNVGFKDGEILETMFDCEDKNEKL